MGASAGEAEVGELSLALGALQVKNGMLTACCGQHMGEHTVLTMHMEPLHSHGHGYSAF